MKLDRIALKRLVKKIGGLQRIRDRLDISYFKSLTMAKI